MISEKQIHNKGNLIELGVFCLIGPTINIKYINMKKFVRLYTIYKFDDVGEAIKTKVIIKKKKKSQKEPTNSLHKKVIQVF